jgi:hypothetical protein
VGDEQLWIVVGDKESILPGIEELGLGPVQEIDVDGNVIGGQ